MTLQLTDVVKTYPQPEGQRLTVLNVPAFAMQQGEQVALVGGSGLGKTTLLNVIAGITRPDSGRVVIDGTEITRLPEAAVDRFRAERIGIVFQTFNLLPAFTALENVLLGMSFARGKSSRSRAKELLGELDLANRLDYRPGQLSVGQQQRVAVARALANNPSLLLADEPTANVDVANQDAILEAIGRTCREHKVSLLLVTHSAAVAARFGRVDSLSEFNRVDGRGGEGEKGRGGERESPRGD